MLSGQPHSEVSCRGLSGPLTYLDMGTEAFDTIISSYELSVNQLQSAIDSDSSVMIALAITTLINYQG